MSFPKKARPIEQTLARPLRYSAEEYFALEEKNRIRHEFFESEVFAMAGASIAHNTIAGNVYMAYRQALRGKKYRVQMEAVRLAVEENRHYAYPDDYPPGTAIIYYGWKTATTPTPT